MRDSRSLIVVMSSKIRKCGLQSIRKPVHFPEFFCATGLAESMAPVCLARILSLLVAVTVPLRICAQEAPQADGRSGETATGQVMLPAIKATPTTIDPASLMTKPLSRESTVRLTNASLAEVGQWIEATSGMPVVFDTSALQAEGISLSEAVSDHLDNAPIYLMLNRLSTLNLAWYVKDDVVRITTMDAAETEQRTIPYLVGDLLDQGFQSNVLSQAIESGLGGKWLTYDAEGGSLEFLGDVLFVRQTHQTHLRLRGLLTALRNPAERTFVFDSPQHEALRSGQAANVTVALRDVPLVEATAQLSQLRGIDIRLDPPALQQARIRERQPVTVNLADRPLKTVLEVMLADLRLTTEIRDGVLWITTPAKSAETMRTAVYDVRDLCRDQNESDALRGAMTSQTGGSWISIDGEGGDLIFARPGLLIVRQTDPMHQKVLRLLRAYRKALKASKPRTQAVDPEREVLTRYYRVQTTVALGLRDFLRRHVAPASWKPESNQEPVGDIIAMLSGGKAGTSKPGVGKGASMTSGIEAEWSVLVVRQTRANHRTIAQIIRRVEHGDERPLEPNSGVQGSGGFGGGYFSIDSSHPQHH